MPILHLASYKGTRSGWHGLVNRAIRFFTKSQYSHSEICIGNPFDGEVVCVSSVGTEGGVRAKKMRLSPEEFDIVPMLGVTEADVYAFLKENNGKPYDLIGCVRAVLPFVSREHPTHWFCSETVATIAKLNDAWRFHPGALHAVVSSLEKK